MTPPMFDVSNIDIWKLKMNAYLKTLGMHVYLTITKKSYLDNNKHIEANTQALEALSVDTRKDRTPAFIFNRSERCLTYRHL